MSDERPHLVTVEFFQCKPLNPIDGQWTFCDSEGPIDWSAELEDCKVPDEVRERHIRYRQSPKFAEHMIALIDDDLGIIEVSPHSYAPTVRPKGPAWLKYSRKTNPQALPAWRMSDMRRYAVLLLLTAALFFLLLFASGCGLDEHAKMTESLEKRIAKMEATSEALGKLKAQSAAELEAALAYFKDSRRWLQEYIQWLRRQEVKE